MAILDTNVVSETLSQKAAARLGFHDGSHFAGRLLPFDSEAARADALAPRRDPCKRAPGHPAAFGTAAVLKEPSAETLADLRVDIDRIDAAMHELLIERGQIIDRLIAIKARQGGGLAFRPAREAAMMRALAERHRGLLPLETVEGIWRIIISTFTYVQSPHSVHCDMSRGDAAMRDSARFHFGFTVPCVPHHSAAGVINAVAEAPGDLGMFALDGGAAAGAWWTKLIPATAPKIIARLPLVERPDHPAGMPVFVIAKPLAEGAARDVVIEAAALDRWRGDYPAALGALGAEIIGNAADGMGLSLLIARPGDVPPDALHSALRAAGAGDLRLVEIGAHAARFDFSARGAGAMS
jgi:chorismate mutase